MIMSIDLHVHTVHSHDASNTLKTLAKLSQKLDVIPAITDHNTCNAWPEAKKLSSRGFGRFVLGEEIKVYHNGKLVGELLGLFMNEPVKSREIFSVIDELKEQDALISVAHPFDIFRKPAFYGFRMLEAVVNKVDAIEVFNARSYMARFNSRAEEFAAQHGLARTAGSDAHFPFEFGNAYVRLQASELEEAKKLIKTNKVDVVGRISPKRAHVFTHLRKFGLLEPQ
jgi:hypothetical protein